MKTPINHGNKMKDVKHLFYPETAVGGFSSVDGTVQFYQRVNAILDKDDLVVDLGAGRGAAADTDTSPYRLALRTLRGKCRKIIGVDVDEVVLNNPTVDEARLIGPDGALPLEDNSVDMIVCDAVFEHISNVDQFSSEIDRVLRVGGWVCARTPNRWGYIGIGTNLIPNRWHVALLKYLQPTRKDIDVFPTCYKLNTVKSLKKAFSPTKWEHTIYSWNAEPAYFGSSRVAWFVMKTLFRLTPDALGGTWNIFLRKK